MSVCTLNDIKDRMGIATTETEYDDMINGIINGLAAWFDRYTGRNLILPDTAVTENYTCYTNCLRLKRYPVVSITSIKEAYNYDFDNTDALTADTDYRLVDEGEHGIIYRTYGNWLAFPDSIQVIYKGGYVAAGVTPGDGETALPADIREAAITQASFLYKRRHDIGLSGQSFDGGSINKFAPMKLLPMVESILNNHRRLSL